MRRGELIIWREKIPDVEKGAFGYISEHWGNEVKCFYLQKPDKERTKVGWKAESYAKVVVEKITNDVIPLEFVERVISEYPNAIHLFGGLRTELQKYIDAYVKLTDGKKFMCIAERPVNEPSIVKHIVKKNLYRYLSFKYNSFISVFLAMGETGVKSYLSLRFKKSVLYPFMYNPYLIKESTAIKVENLEINNPLKFLYLGRFDYRFKGCDLLMKAIDNIDVTLNDKWSLTLVGGYGDQTKEIIEWAAKKNNVINKGSWNQNEIINKMSEYDVCIVPSRQDGWNLNPNYSIFAHIGMIISDEAVSHEIIENSKSGVVYQYNDVPTLTKQMEYTINNKEIVSKWKQKTYEFMDKVSAEAVGKYFIEIVDFTYYNSKKKPVCPWLIKNANDNNH